MQSYLGHLQSALCEEIVLLGAEEGGAGNSIIVRQKLVCAGRGGRSVQQMTINHARLN